jgi:hypothetical protein
MAMVRNTQLQPLQMQNGSNNIMVQWTMPEDGTIALNTNDVDEKYKHVIQQVRDNNNHSMKNTIANSSDCT